MRGRLGKTLIAIAAAMLAAALWTSCGGEERDSTGTAAPEAGTAAADSTTEKTTASDDSPPYVVPEVRKVKTGPLRVKATGPEQFSDIGDYTTLTTDAYKESTPQALAEAARVIHEYLVAHVTYDWATSCSLIDEHAMGEVTILGSHFEEVAGKDCPTIISYLLGKVPARKAYVKSEVDAGVLRVRREGGHLFYRAGGRIYTINLSRDEDGSWKLASLFVTNPPS